jgi:hypothetical protein
MFVAYAPYWVNVEAFLRFIWLFGVGRWYPVCTEPPSSKIAPYAVAGS